MKIFYTASLRGVKSYRESLQNIYNLIDKLGHKNLDNVLFNIEDRKEFYSGDHDAQIVHFNRIIKSIKDSDIVILEVSTHSLSMGFILHKALEMNKPVIALYQPGNPPFFAQGIENEKLQVIEYSDADVEGTLKDAIDYAQGKADVRFNFFISPSIGTYLDWISKVKKIPRSVYLRGLIEKDQSSNDEYNS
ncbi:MAG: hypothetical protein COZ34_02940 [Candidatus Pacebacteria bacterium CG_4_10_14_3_um_filter_34_15]|nr:MAG: hypothetical protein COZ34_02940 [Candidatus Pacebacteria bacterium CG_4_10_14_3_um_filter_34_15]